MLTLESSSLRCQIYLRNILQHFWEALPAKLLCCHLAKTKASFRKEVIMQLIWQLGDSFRLWQLPLNMPAEARHPHPFCILYFSNLSFNCVLTCTGPQTRSFPSERTCKSWPQVCCWSDHGNIDSCLPLCKLHAWNIWKYETIRNELSFSNPHVKRNFNILRDWTTRLDKAQPMYLEAVFHFHTGNGNAVRLILARSKQTMRPITSDNIGWCRH